MDQQLLSSRDIIGRYYRALEQDVGGAWLDAVSNMFGSDQASETYNFLGQSPVMRKWIGARNAKSFGGDGITIVNDHYEATLEIAVKDARRDKTGQINARVGEFAQRGNAHWASLISTLIVNGESALCYDGQYFFDTDHSEGDSGSQSNDLTVDITGLPVATHGPAATAPSVEEMQQAILASIVKMIGFVDDQGEPMNENANNFLVMVPHGLMAAGMSAVSKLVPSNLDVNMDPNLLKDFNVKVVPNVRLTMAGWTTKFATFRTDSSVKALIRQTETEIEMKAKAEGSEFEFDNDAWQFGIDGWRGCGYGYWQHACLTTLTKS